jgi:transcriptional regulator with XRE-family HTH domain
LSNQGKRYYRDEQFLKEIGKRIEQLMKARNITHEVFNNDTGLNPHRVISGEQNLTISTFKKICDYLEVGPEEFFKGL